MTVCVLTKDKAPAATSEHVRVPRRGCNEDVSAHVDPQCAQDLLRCTNLCQSRRRRLSEGCEVLPLLVLTFKVTCRSYKFASEPSLCDQGDTAKLCGTFPASTL